MYASQKHFSCVAVTFQHTNHIWTFTCILRNDNSSRSDVDNDENASTTIEFVIPINHKEACLTHIYKNQRKLESYQQKLERCVENFIGIQAVAMKYRIFRRIHKLRKSKRSDSLNEYASVRACECVCARSDVDEAATWSLLHQQNYFALSWKFNKITFHSTLNAYSLSYTYCMQR